MNSIHTYDVIIIGGGASGMMTAVIAGERGKKVLLIEKNKTLGAKLRITGGGRCNITNNERDLRTLLSNYGESEQFLYSAFTQFGVDDTFAFFEQHGLPLTTQARKRVFPQTEKAVDVCNLLISLLQKHHVEVLTDCVVVSLEKNNDKISAVITRCKGVQDTWVGDSIVLATGGLSHPETGSTGDGFSWLTTLGHTVHKPTPNIVPLAVSDAWIKDLAGTSLSGIRITFFVDGKKSFSLPKKSSEKDDTAGKLLCTHFGLSGPLVLNASKQVADLMYDGQVTATIDCFPDKNIGELEQHIISIFDANKNKLLKNVFSDIAPTGSARVILGLLPHINPDTQVNSITREARKELVRLLKALPVTITGLMGFDRAVVADGGMDIAEVDFRTMRSKIISNLFATGDVLDIQRPTGGFSLQLCWTTGYVAGKNV